METWFTSDNHFGHKNIIEYCKRPFYDVRQMDECMIEGWNSRVGWKDTVYHLGDFAFLKIPEAQKILRKLNGIIILVKGNHDKSIESMLEIGFSEVHSELILELDIGRILLTHKPAANFKWCDYNFCGHVHDVWKTHKMSTGKLHINVGVDQWGFKPVNIMEITDEIRRVEDED